MSFNNNRHVTCIENRQHGKCRITAKSQFLVLLHLIQCSNCERASGRLTTPNENCVLLKAIYVQIFDEKQLLGNIKR